MRYSCGPRARDKITSRKWTLSTHLNDMTRRVFIVFSDDPGKESSHIQLIVRDLNGALETPVAHAKLLVDGRPTSDFREQIEHRLPTQRFHRLVDVQTRLVIFLSFSLGFVGQRFGRLLCNNRESNQVFTHPIGILSTIHVCH